MLYLVSKVLQIVVEPGDLLLILLAIGIWRLATSRRRKGLALVTLVLVVGAAIAVVPVADLPLVPLESRFPALHALPAKVDGIILLGGAVDPERTAEYGQVALNQSAARITEIARLARHYPVARIVLSGGVGGLLNEPITEARATAQLLIELGVAQNRLVIEDRSRTTHENTVFSKALIDPKPGEVWILVTSAAHMPRAVGCFRRVGWPVVADPVDFEATDRFHISFADGIRSLSYAEHEWLGLLAYRAAGWTTALLPGP
ncbi:MAG: YdcF family protein [Alphaproteobacteria bacterium]|nr:YdcF family protein [Alphaproteobacteria bacterium]